MKKTIACVTIALALSFPAPAAEVTTVKLSNVHLCCQNCVKGVQAATAKVADATVSVDKDAGTVSLAGPNTATVQKAADALVGAGYFGKSSDPQIKISAATGAKGHKVQSLKVDGVHLCCGKCVTAVDKAVKSVPGVKSDNAVKDAESFEVVGDFNDQEVFAALHKVGLTGKVGK